MVSVLINAIALGDIAEELGVPIRTTTMNDCRPEGFNRISIEIAYGKGKAELFAYVKAPNAANQAPPAPPDRL